MYKSQMDNSYTIRITQIYKVTVGASNEDEACELAEHFISTSPEQYATELYSEVEAYEWWTTSENYLLSMTKHDGLDGL